LEKAIFKEKPLSRIFLAALSLSAILLTGCSNITTESKASSTATPSSSSALESGLALQEKAKKAGKTLEEDPLKDLENSEMK
jgi:outer membrane murein-binding lipoprotein Lpp